MPRKKELTFEESLTKLEAIVTQMENGDASLQDLMANYSEGIKLSENCLMALERAEKTMDLMVHEQDGQAVETELTIEEK